MSSFTVIICLLESENARSSFGNYIYYSTELHLMQYRIGSHNYKEKIKHEKTGPNKETEEI